MPQGTVLGPLLFLAYINDLLEAVDYSDSCLFAADCLVYKLIESDADAMRLQEDLEALEEWEKLWQMQFTRRSARSFRSTTINASRGKTNYKLHGHTLEVVDSWKYLGVNISSDLSWHTHVDAMAAKASKTLRFLRRNLSECTKEVKRTAYTALVRPMMEYASPAWDPSSS